MNTNPPKTHTIVRISSQVLENEFSRVLLKLGFDFGKAKLCAQVFTENSLDGVYTHGVNRFPRFVRYIKKGVIDVQAEPELKHRTHALEQWDGHLGPGILNALFSTDRAVALSRESGIGCVALAYTNHWMRGGTYAWRAAKAGCIFLGWTNTMANMPAWGAQDCHLGNNPFVVGVPYKGEAIVLDMAMSQFSYGTMELYQLRGKQLPVPGGYDSAGQLTKDPSAILESTRALPMGFWKGSGLALLLDILSTVLSGGTPTAEVLKHEMESSLSQVFITIDVSRLGNHQRIAHVVNSIIEDLHRSVPTSEGGKILYPGERVLLTRKENLERGIPIDTVIWEEIQAL